MQVLFLIAQMNVWDATLSGASALRRLQGKLATRTVPGCVRLAKQVQLESFWELRGVDFDCWNFVTFSDPSWQGNILMYSTAFNACEEGLQFQHSSQLLGHLQDALYTVLRKRPAWMHRVSGCKLWPIRETGVESVQRMTIAILCWDVLRVCVDDDIGILGAEKEVVDD